MQTSDIPVKMPTPWASSAGGGFTRVVPVPSQIGIQDGAASFVTGFPPLNFLPIGAGGVPPFGQDFNGLLNAVSAWLRWVQAGGAPVIYDGTFQTTVGGYPAGAVVMSALAAPSGMTVNSAAWVSLADNNTTNPDIGGAAATWAVWNNNNLRSIASNAASLTLSLVDRAIGLVRSAPPAVQVVNLIAIPGQVQVIEDLSGNFSPTTLVRATPPGGHTISGGPSFDLAVAKVPRGFRFYGGTAWSVA